MNIKQPQIETLESLTTFLNDYNVPENIDVFVFESIETLNEEYSNGLSVPGAAFYNKNGYFVDYRVTPTDCNANVGPFIRNAQSINNMSYDETKSISMYNNKIKQIKTDDSYVYSNDLSVDGYIVIRWAKYMGKVNDDKSFNWVNIYKEEKENGKQLQLIFLNCDYQKSWNIDENDLPKFK